MENPKIEYLISSKKFSNDSSVPEEYELIIGKYIENRGTDAIVVTRNKEKGALNGSNLKFTKSGLIVSDKDNYTFEDISVGIEDDKAYLYLDNTGVKLWYLPEQVIDFLNMYKNPSFYALSIIENKPVIMKLYTRNTNNSRVNVEKTINVELRKEDDAPGLTLSNNYISKECEFILYNSDDKNEKLNKSYFKLYNSTFYLEDCYLRESEDKIGIFSNCKINNELLSNVTCCLGYGNL